MFVIFTRFIRFVKSFHHSFYIYSCCAALGLFVRSTGKCVSFCGEIVIIIIFQTHNAGDDVGFYSLMIWETDHGHGS